MYRVAIVFIGLCALLMADSFDNQALEDMKNYKAESKAREAAKNPAKEDAKKPPKSTSKFKQFFLEPSSVFRQQSHKEEEAKDQKTKQEDKKDQLLTPTNSSQAQSLQSTPPPATTPSQDIKKDSKPLSKYREYVKRKESQTIFTIGSVSIEELNGNYIMPVYYNFLPQYARYLQQNEAKIQLSFKVATTRNFLWTGGTLYFNYTQKFFFQFYNFRQSSPIRDINFQPELMYNYPLDIKFLGGTFSGTGISLTHLSNGEGKGYRTQSGAVIGFERAFSDPAPTGADVIGTASKSSNRVVLHGIWHTDNLRVELKAWAPLGQRRTNPDLYDYLGYGQLDLAYRHKRNIFEATLTGLGAKRANYLGSLQLAYTYKVNARAGIYIQYHYGYMDSLYEYNFLVNRVGIGFRFIK
ncbi:phospholipase A [Helicobacter sp. 11S02629-2]|uniref:phospholipase A n=1 Tax=Helicobacter sp. 11S02629-2 TaxID=1476195 RepID=UPI000BA64D47|nr:phospholipase A [Helicobacter sp. 11S02629-2]PAF45836.1 hypothetical protein BKH40_00010 [Helicobacter sp. 11S02629-2]